MSRVGGSCYFLFLKCLVLKDLKLCVLMLIDVVKKLAILLDASKTGSGGGGGGDKIVNQ